MVSTMRAKDGFLTPGALDLSEKAVFLLRRNGIALAEYYIGSLPFFLGLLFFWSDMSRNPYAGSYAAPAAGGLALLFIWMKVWQVRFCRRLWCTLNDTPFETWEKRRFRHVAVRQAALHATGLIVLPIAVLIMLPLGWVYAFFQNVTVLDGPEARGLKEVYRDSVDQAALWPGQNHLMLLIVWLFGLFVLLNVAVGLMLVPYLLKWLTGIESAFTIGGLHALTHTTFLAIAGVLTHLAIDPIIKAAYVLRCFCGRSRHTGDDLRAVIKPFLTAAMLLLFAFNPTVCFAESAAADQRPTGGVPLVHRAEAERLDEAIEQVLQQRRFAWRLPREKTPQPEDESAWAVRFAHWLKRKVTSVAETIDRWMTSLSEWLNKRFPGKSGYREGGIDARAFIRVAFYALGIGFLVLLVLSLRRWRIRRNKLPAPERVRAQADPNIEDETISAAALPTDRWLALAQDLAERGDLRLALRALYLAVLALLGDRGRVNIARYKSNRDYLNELARRAHAEPELFEKFGRCVADFERAWYGMHPVEQAQLTGFKGAQERTADLGRHAA
jgi:hypothetical protein